MGWYGAQMTKASRCDEARADKKAQRRLQAGGVSLGPGPGVVGRRLLSLCPSAAVAAPLLSLGKCRTRKWRKFKPALEPNPGYCSMVLINSKDETAIF